MIKPGQYDFLDFGSGKGGCATYATKKLEGKNHLCFEIRKEAVDNLNSLGHPCVHADITAISLPKKAVRFVTMSHVLEHLPTIDHVTKVLQTAVEVATDFVFIEGPTFDFDKYLKKQGFKFFWHDSCGHTAKVTTSHIYKLSKQLGVRTQYWLVEQPYVDNSLSRDILPYNTPSYPNRYKEKIHPKKEYVSFTHEKVFRSWICFLVLTEINYVNLLIHSRHKFVVSSIGIQ